MKYHFLFDYDGVLVHKTDFAQSMAERYDVKEDAIRAFFQQHLKKCIRGQADMLLLIQENLEAFNWQGDARSFFDALYFEDNQYNTGLLDLIRLKIASDFSCDIATNQDMHRGQALREEEVVKDLFGQVFCSSELGVAKPDQGYFEQVYALLLAGDARLKKEDIVFIDDLKENVATAASFGFKTHWYKNQEGFEAFLNSCLLAYYTPALKTEAFSLVPMALSHAQGYSAILSEKDTYQFLSESGPVSEEKALLKIQGNQQSTIEGRSVYWSIVNADQVFIGYIAVHNLKGEKVAISYGIHPDHRRKGIASAALKLVLEWEGGENKAVEMAAHVENTASFQMLSKLKLPYLGIQDTPFGKRHVFRMEK